MSFNLIWSYLTLSNLNLIYIIFSSSILYYPILFCPVLFSSLQFYSILIYFGILWSKPTKCWKGRTLHLTACVQAVFNWGWGSRPGTSACWIVSGRALQGRSQIRLRRIQGSVPQVACSMCKRNAPMRILKTFENICAWFWNHTYLQKIISIDQSRNAASSFEVD